MVTVDGTVVEASEDAHADLFWAIRGGGGNFGVVTRLDFRLHPVDEVVGGILIWPVHAAAEPMRVFRDVALAAPDDFSTQAVLGHSAQNGQCVFGVIVCSTGPEEEPELLRRLRGVGGLALDEVRRRPYLEQQSLLDMPFGLRHYWKGHFVRELPDALLDGLEQAIDPDVPRGSILIEAIHGAAARVPREATPVGFRDAAFNISALGIWDDPATDDVQVEWARETAALAAPYSLQGGGYLNYMQADEPAERVRAAFGAEAFRAAAGGQAAVRPGERAPLQPEHPARLMAVAGTRGANQPPPLAGYNLYEQDAALVEGLRREGGAAWEERIAAFGERARRRAARMGPARERASAEASVARSLRRAHRRDRVPPGVGLAAPARPRDAGALAAVDRAGAGRARRSGDACSCCWARSRPASGVRSR